MKCYRRFFNLLGIFWLILQLLINCCASKNVEGRLKTLEDWAFLARFCFISGRGKYEYEIEFDRKYGEPQLLLYYDDKTQWPAVYKSGKTCPQKLSVLREDDNQIIPLSIRTPYNFKSGCIIVPKDEEKIKPANRHPPYAFPTTNPIDSLTGNDDNENVTNPTEFDKFLKTTSTPTISKQSRSLTENLSEAHYLDDGFENFNFTGFNDTDVFNASALSGDTSTHNGGGITFKRDMIFENKLENTTEYRIDVEELFEMSDRNRPVSEKESYKKRRSGGTPFQQTTRETLLVRCHNAGTFFSSRERWWYIAIASCGNEKGLDIKYRFKMTNGPSGDFWTEHFSADEMLIPPILLVNAIAYTILLIALFFCTVELKSLHLYHCTYRLFGCSVLFQWFGILVQGVAWVKYGLTGHGPHTTVGALFMSASEIEFLLLMLLMAKGYTITRARLSSCSIVKLTIFINTYIVSYVVLFVYQAEAFDPGEVLNLYESPAGFGLSLMRCIAWCAFMISTATTIRKYPEKSSFYYPFGLFGSMWLLGGPFLTLVGIGVLDAWVRESVMCGTFALMAFGGHSIFLYLTWPSRANKSFPYHVRTNHVGIASENDDGADYPRHTYEPSKADQSIIIPLSRRTEELINGNYGQYIYEHQMCNSNVHSHASFPDDLNAPSDILPSSQLTNQFATNTENDLSKSDADNRFSNYLQQSVAENVSSRPPSAIFNNDDNQADSGHPSLEHSGSPSNNTTKSISNNGTPSSNIRKDSIESIKSNPFVVVNGVKQTPNKIILEPIEQSIRNMNLTANVPKHLFAARKLAE